MKKTKLTHISDFKVGDTIEILNKPEYWHSQLNGNDPLIANLTYPYVLTIKEIREDAMTCGNYEWDLDAIIEAGCNKIEIPKTWYVFVTEENQEVLFNWRFKDPSLNCKLTTNHIVGKSIISERAHNCRKLTKNFGNEISYEDFKKYILKENVNQKEMNTEKQIVQYRFKNEQFLEVAKKIVPALGVFTINSITYNTLNKLNLIDIWCDPVYEVKLPEINGYEGKIDGERIKYGCANLHIQWFTQTDTRHIDVVTLSSGVTIYKEQIDAIREYLRHKKLI